MKFVVGGWIIVLVIVLALLISIWVLIKKITSKIESFSRMAFGTSDIRKGVEQMELEYATTPKSVSGMTNLYLPKIAADFPEFEYNEMRTRAVNVLCTMPATPLESLESLPCWLPWGLATDRWNERHTCACWWV